MLLEWWFRSGGAGGRARGLEGRRGRNRTSLYKERGPERSGWGEDEWGGGRERKGPTDVSLGEGEWGGLIVQ